VGSSLLPFVQTDRDRKRKRERERRDEQRDRILPAQEKIKIQREGFY
jgi:hypothetical protein